MFVYFYQAIIQYRQCIFVWNCWIACLLCTALLFQLIKKTHLRKYVSYLVKENNLNRIYNPLKVTFKYLKVTKG